MSVVQSTMTKAALGWFVVCIGICLSGLMFAPPFAEGASASGDTPLGGPLVVAGGEWLEGPQQELAALRAWQASPEAVAARARSRTEYEHMDQGAVVGLARTAFPEVIDHPAVGTLRLPSGAHLGRYVTPFAAQVELPGGKHAVVESLSAIAAPAGHGNYTPLDLALKQTAGAYAPATSDVALRIPKQLHGGVAVPGSGVSITPVSAQGTPLQGSEGTLDGSSVLYANTQTDSDTLIRPTPAGFDLDSELRSVRSPGTLYFRLDLPRGARLVQGPRGSHMMRVLRDKTVLATILPPSAQDADGLPVPVSMSSSGNTLVVSVHKTELNDLPIVVDPEVIDSKVTEPSRWKFGPPNPPHFVHYELENWLEQESTGEYPSTEHAFISYQTQGNSHIYFVGTYLKVQNEGNMEAILELDHESSGKEVSEDTQLVAKAKEEVYTKTYFKVCAEYSAYPTCPLEGKWTEYGAEHNEVKLQESATAAGSGYNHANLLETNVFIAQPKGPEAEFNTTEQYLKNDNGQRNVLYGSGGWMGQYSGAFEVKAKDAGVGVSKLSVRSTAWKTSYEYLKEGLCEGVQCKPEVNSIYTYNSAAPNGEDEVTAESEDATVTFSPEVHRFIKVYDKKPHSFKLVGLAETGGQLSAGKHEISAEATSGEGTEVNPGIKSIAMTIDGKGIGSPNGSCSGASGPCTAKGTWTVNGEELGSGVHHMIITAFDNAGNEAKEGYTFAVTEAAPVAIGPGNVDPVSGQFSLSATDISLAGVGGVARSYQSQELTAGSEGPLGPQWRLTLGGSGNELEVLPNNDVLLSGATHGLTSFSYKSNNEYESPTGDTNLKLSFEPKEHVYLLKDSVAGTTLKFTQPEGSQSVAPSFANEIGSSNAEGGTLDNPSGVAVDKEGNQWVANTLGNNVEKFSPSGEHLASYAPVSMLSPQGIAVSPKNGNIYIADTGKNRIDEMTPSGTLVTTFGELGTAHGDLKGPHGIAIDSSGDVWVSDSENNRVEEFSESGTYESVIGSNGVKEGSGTSEFKGPTGIALCNGLVYVVDRGNNRIQYFSTAAKYEGKWGSEGTANGNFKAPSQIACEAASNDLYVTDTGNNRVQEFSGSGSFLNTFGTVGKGGGEFSAPIGVAVANNETVYVSDSEDDRLEQFSRPTWIGTIAEGPAANDAQTYEYRMTTVEGHPVIEPIEELGPKPSGVTCSAEPSKSEKGCRELTFKYAEKTTAGESPSEWGEYAGRLVKILFTAYNPATKAMVVEQPVAQYAYDKKGRLRAEWDPRITPNLKTTYGYDSEGDITAVAPPGNQPWLMHYGTFPGAPSPGRLLSVTRPGAATTLASGAAPANTVAPTLSSTKPAVGTKISVSTNGTWSNSPLTYSYHWEACSSTGEKCAPIVGAVNQSYYPVKSNEGHTLVAVVEAYNATGMVGAATAEKTSAVASGTEDTPLPEPPSAGTTSVWTVDYQVPVSGSGAPHEMTTAKLTEWGQTRTSRPKRPRSLGRANRWAGPPRTTREPRLATATTPGAPSTPQRPPAASQRWNTTPPTRWFGRSAPTTARRRSWSANLSTKVAKGKLRTNSTRKRNTTAKTPTSRRSPAPNISSDSKAARKLRRAR